MYTTSKRSTQMQCKRQPIRGVVDRFCAGGCSLSVIIANVCAIAIRSANLLLAQIRSCAVYTLQGAVCARRKVKVDDAGRLGLTAIVEGNHPNLAICTDNIAALKCMDALK